MKHIGVYYRVSTDRQDLASQQTAISAWLAGLEQAERPLTVRVFEDFAQSGRKSQREAYQELLKAAFAHEIDTIVVYRLDRLSRNASEAIQVLLMLDQAGVGFVSITQPVLNLGLDNPFRRTMLAAFSEIAEIERDTIVSRVRSGLEAAKKRGVQLGRPQVLGADVQSKVHELRQEGLSYHEIGRRLKISHVAAMKLAKGPAR